MRVSAKGGKRTLTKDPLGAHCLVVKLCFTALAMILVMLSSAAVACSCARPEDLTERQLRYAMRDLSLIARGRVVAVRYPLGCRIAPIRWAYSLMEARLPVTYSIAISETLWGRPVATAYVVQWQVADWDACKPLGSAACEPVLPRGDALWVLKRMPNGEQRYAGRCGLMLAPHFLRLSQQSARADQM